MEKNPRILKYNEEASTDYKELWDTISEGKVWEGIFQNINKYNEIYWERAFIFPVQVELSSQMKETKKIVGILTDITEEYLQKKEIEKLTVTDQLTTLMNRRGVMEKLESEFNRFKRYKNSIFFLMLDIDEFKIINDTYGHDIGDKALSIFAKQCKKSIRKTDIIGRIGGDEFAIGLINTNLKEGEEIITRIKEKIKQISVYIPSVNKTIRLEASIGITKFYETDQSIDDIYIRADKAMYCAKAEKGISVCWETPLYM